jgi:hypothetical protein
VSFAAIWWWTLDPVQKAFIVAAGVDAASRGNLRGRRTVAVSIHQGE